MPTPKDVHIDAALSQISLKYRNKVFIADKVFPIVDVKKDSGYFFKYGIQNIGNYNLERAPGNRAQRVDWSMDTPGLYTCKEIAVELAIYDELRDNADEAIDIDADTTEDGTEIISLKREIMVASKVMTDTNYQAGMTSTPTTKWDASNGDPVGDIETAKMAVQEKAMVVPNTLVVPFGVHQKLRRNSTIRDYFKYTKGGIITAEMLKEVFEVDNYLVGTQVYNAAAEGANKNLTQVWSGDNVAVLYVPNKPGLKEQSFGYIFRRIGYPQVLPWREDAKKSDFLQISDKFDVQIVAPYAGYLLTDVLS